MHTPSYVDLRRPTIFAHRGASAYAPENTLSAFKLAAEQHADGIELDAKLSADGQVVVIHDDSVNRTTNGTGRIKSLSLSDIQKLDAGSKIPPLFKPDQIPTLEQVFDVMGGKLFINVELTNYTSPLDDLPDKVVSLVKRFNLEDSVLFSSFNMLALIKARSLLPNIPLGVLTFEKLAGLTVQSRLVRFGPFVALHPAFEDITPQLIQRVHQAKSRLRAYTVNQPEVMHRLFIAGVDGIFTDDPLVAIKVREEIC